MLGIFEYLHSTPAEPVSCSQCAQDVEAVCVVPIVGEMGKPEEWVEPEDGVWIGFCEGCMAKMLDGLRKFKKAGTS